jgi:hypothetical protein
LANFVKIPQTLLPIPIKNNHLQLLEGLHLPDNNKSPKKRGIVTTRPNKLSRLQELALLQAVSKQSENFWRICLKTPE